MELFRNSFLSPVDKNRSAGIGGKYLLWTKDNILLHDLTSNSIIKHDMAS